jgi:hypothetical protein
LVAGIILFLKKFNKIEAFKDLLMWNSVIKSVLTVYLNLCFGAFIAIKTASSIED